MQKISIITPCYNQVEFIERTIQSVIGQKYQNLEYIIIDGGSTDGTIDIIKQYSDVVKWISEKDNGQSDAINKGLRMASGDIVAFLNSDDTYIPQTFNLVNDYFSRNPNIAWASGKCRIIDQSDAEIRRLITWYKNFLLKHYSFPLLLSENFISQPSTFWRRSVLDNIGYLNEEEHYCMDYEYWLRIGNKYPLGYINQYLANFRYYQTSKSGGNIDKQFQDQHRLAKVYRDNHPIAVYLNKVNYYKTVFLYKTLFLLQS